jgi:HD-like signal output (HDOD) protein/CheY-like chemotaxis protein
MKRILFVDDEKNILGGLRRTLYAERARWDMEFALGGEAALRICEAGNIDVVVSDMQMPGMDGATLLSRIRDRHPNTARIALSGYAETGLAARAVSLAHRFLAKPCSVIDLRAAIEQVCSLQDILSAPEIRALVGTVGELPSLSITYSRLMQAVADPETSTTQLANIIEKDVAMSAKVLQLANSAFFGLGQQVTTLQNATTYLGTATIKNLALVSEAFRIFVPDARVPQSSYASMQRHSQHTAALAALLPVNCSIRDVTVVAALLHDIGTLFLASTVPDKYCAVLARASERGCKFFEAELELLGTSHAEIGAYLLGLWGIPSLTVEAIAHHHDPTRIPHAGLDNTVAVYVADLLVHELDAHPQGSTGLTIDESDHASLVTLGVLPMLPEFRKLALQSRAALG